MLNRHEAITLNCNQRSAIDWGTGALLVLAGPGSGKTHVLTARMVRLIQESKAESYKILGLTFTTRAAEKMRKRVEEQLESRSHRIHIRTFHSFCAAVLRQHGSHIGLSPNYEILDQEKDRVNILDEVVEEMDLEGYESPQDTDALGVVEYLMREGYGWKINENLPLDKPMQDWAMELYQRYINRLIEENFMDYGSLLVCCLRLFKEQPMAVKLYRMVYKHICVDEYQDTNKAQDKIIRELCEVGNANLFVVADKNQVIYQWNGASPLRLSNLERDYAMTTLQLPENYRCPRRVVDLANSLMQNGGADCTGGGGQSDQVTCSNDNVVRLEQFPNDALEFKWIGSDICRRKLDIQSCVVVARNTKLLESAANTLNDNGIVTRVVRKSPGVESSGVNFIHASIQLAGNPCSKKRLEGLCGAYFGLTGLAVRPEKVAAESALAGETMLQRFVLAAKSKEGACAKAPLEYFEKYLASKQQYMQFVESALDWLDNRHYPEGEGSDGDDIEEDEKLMLRKNIESIRRQYNGEPTLGQFLHEISLATKVPSAKSGEMQCSTIHAIKGREFNHVYLIGMAEDILPSYYSRINGSSSKEMEEERRSCFVAITRVKETLTITTARSYFGRPKMPSRFLFEMGLIGKDNESQA